MTLLVKQIFSAVQKPQLASEGSSELPNAGSTELQPQGRSPTASRRNSAVLREQRAGDATGEVSETVFALAWLFNKRA